MSGKTHKKETRLISKPVKLNLMYGKVKSKLSKGKISEKLSKHSYAVGIQHLNDNLIFKFKNNTELARHLNITKFTLSKYPNSGLFTIKGIIFFLL